jgi:hypothetical protein
MLYVEVDSGKTLATVRVMFTHEYARWALDPRIIWSGAIDLTELGLARRSDRVLGLVSEELGRHFANTPHLPFTGPSDSS